MKCDHADVRARFRNSGWRRYCAHFPFASAGRGPDFDHRTKTEHLATILLPNPVAAHVTKRDVVDGDAEILKENRTEQNGSLLAEMAAAPNFECGAFDHSLWQR
jgi:hypothetical protein